MNNNYYEGSILNNALSEMKKQKCCCPKYVLGATGPTGPQGEPGISETILVSNTRTLDPSENAAVIDIKNNQTHMLEFDIPRGRDGAIGPTGPTGPAGTSITILGSYDSIDQLQAENPNGNLGDGYLVGDDLYVWSDNENSWANVGTIKGPTGPAGPQGIEGPTGPAGPQKISAAYFVSFEDNYPSDGLEIREGERLPIMRKELDTGNICEYDPNDNTIQFNKEGYYKISFTVNAYVPYFNTSFDSKIDFIAIGFELAGTNVPFVGDSQWATLGAPIKLFGQGIITVDNIANAYELINLSKRSIFLKTPNLKDTNTGSYFINAPVTIIVEYLGK